MKLFQRNKEKKSTDKEPEVNPSRRKDDSMVKSAENISTDKTEAIDSSNGKNGADIINKSAVSAKPAPEESGEKTKPVKLDKQALEEQIIIALKQCYDPEIPVDIFELGLIYEIRIDDEANVIIKMTLTSPACPVAGSLPGDVERKIKGVGGVNDVKIELVWSPPWDRDMMSEVAKLELGML